MNLRIALRLSRDCRLALVGAGGKTTALFRLARAFEGPVIVTASTHLGEWQTALADQHIIVQSEEGIANWNERAQGVILFTGPLGDDRRFSGLDNRSLEAVRKLADRLDCPLLVEADGARQKPLKAPAEHEPAIPGWVRQVVVCVGLSSLGKPLDAEWVHRPERLIDLVKPGKPKANQTAQTITEETLIKLLLHPQGGLKNIPEGARKIALLNQADDLRLILSGRRIAGKLSGSYDALYDAVLVAALSHPQEDEVSEVIEPTVGIVLAGGGSARFGQPKMLLDWNGKPLVRRAVETALESGLKRMIVVVGAVNEPVRRALAGLNVKVVENADWQAGQSTSMRAGLSEVIGQNAGSVIFLLSDQPFVTPGAIRALVDEHRQTLAAITALRVGGRRANPVLFDRQTFEELMTIQGDVGGRALFQRYETAWVDWADERLLLDVDTPEDYARLLEIN